MNILDRLAGCDALLRTYYGDYKDIQPNDHCFWSDSDFMVGWYENDEHLKARIKERFKIT